MPTSSQPGPDDHDDPVRLSSWEQRVLADIEADLLITDPHLAREMSHRTPGAAQGWWPLAARYAGLLLVALPVLVLAGAVVPASWWAGLAIFITLIVVPGLLLVAIEKNQSD